MNIWCESSWAILCQEPRSSEAVLETAPLATYIALHESPKKARTITCYIWRLYINIASFGDCCALGRKLLGRPGRRESRCGDGEVLGSSDQSLAPKASLEHFHT